MPAALLVAAIIFSTGAVPTITNEGVVSTDWTTLAAAMFVSALVLRVLLDRLNDFFTQVLSGLTVIPARVADWGRDRHTKKLEALMKEIERLKEEQTDKALDRAYELERQRFQSYPTTGRDVLPTTLGNHIDAWEHGIDASILWSRVALCWRNPCRIRLPRPKRLRSIDQCDGAAAGVGAPAGNGAGGRSRTPLGRRGTGVERVGRVPDFEVSLVRAATACAIRSRPRSTCMAGRASADGRHEPAIRVAEQERQLWRQVIWPMKFDYEPSLTYSMARIRRGGERCVTR